MKVSLLLSFLISFNSCWGFIFPGFLKEIERCELVFDADAFLPGGEIALHILTTLKDSTKLASNDSFFYMNFANYNFSLKGPAEIVKKHRKEISIRINEDAYKNPYVVLSIELRRNKAIRWEKKVPIRYDLMQAVSFAGKDGYDPRASTDNGYRTIPLGNTRVNIQFIDNTGTLSNNSDPNIIGEKGKDLTVFMSVIVLESGEEVIKVRINTQDGESILKYFFPIIGGLEIFTIGGQGGISKSGGKGGDGGDVTIYVRPEAKLFLNQLFISNFGGRGGDVWRPENGKTNRGQHGEMGDLKIIDWEY